MPLENVDQDKIRPGCGPLFLAPQNLTHTVERSTVAVAAADTAVEQIAVASARGWPGGRSHWDQHGDETQVELQALPHLLLLLSDKSLLMQHGCLLLLLCRNGSITGQPGTGRV